MILMTLEMGKGQNNSFSLHDRWWRTYNNYIPGNNKGNHAEKQLIKELIKQGEVKEPDVTNMFKEMSLHKTNKKTKKSDHNHIHKQLPSLSISS